MPFVLGDNGPVRGERGRGGSRREDWPVIESSGEGEGSNHRPFKRCSSWAANNINRATSQSHNGPLWRRPVARARSLSRVNARNINRERRRALLSSRDEYYHPLRHPGFLLPPPPLRFLFVIFATIADFCSAKTAIPFRNDDRPSFPCCREFPLYLRK